jgi:hypothetical protein
MTHQADESPPDEQLRLVRVYNAVDFQQTVEIRLLLQRLGVPFRVRNEGIQNLFGLAPVGGMSLLAGPVEFWVRAEDAPAVVAAIETAAKAPEEVPGTLFVAECPACGAEIYPTDTHCPDCNLAFV